MLPTAHFMAFFGAGAAAFAFRIAFVATNACSLAALLTTFIAFIAAARIAFVGTIACLVALLTAFIAFFGAAAFAARIAFVGKKAALVPLFTAFIAFIAAARIAFAITRREVSTIPLKRLKTNEMRS